MNNLLKFDKVRRWIELERGAVDRDEDEEEKLNCFSAQPLPLLLSAPSKLTFVNFNLTDCRSHLANFVPRQNPAH